MSKLMGSEFFRKYSDIVLEAETAKMSKKEAADQINKVLMQAAQGGIDEDAINEGLKSKILPLVAAATIGIGGLGASDSAHADQVWQSRETATNQYGQQLQRDCMNRATQVADLFDRYGRVMASHPEIIKQCGPYVLTGQPIIIHDSGRGDDQQVARTIVGILGAAAIINQINHHGGEHDGRYDNRRYNHQRGGYR